MDKLSAVIIFGSESDVQALKEKQNAKKIFDSMGIEVTLAIASAHRTPEELTAWLRQCWDLGERYYITVAGMAAALPGFVAATLRRAVVYGVPMPSDNFGSLDSMLSCIQMPPGVPVRTMTPGVVGFNQAALCVCQDIAVNDEVTADLLQSYIKASTKPANLGLSWFDVFPAA